MKHYTIPVFVPELACPFQCIYCNQRLISSQQDIPTEQEIIETIESHLQSFKPHAKVQIGFFGGNFTGIPVQEQKMFLNLAKPYLEKGLVESIRLSTRPDYINDENLVMLKSYGVKEIELGVQSFDEEVLRQSERGYTPQQVVEAAKKIKEAGFDLGMQMMLGLLTDTKEKAVYTAHKIVELGATSTRIYPTLVIEDTHLETLYKQGKYTPLLLEEAVEWAKAVYEIFDAAGVTMLRMGLHPTKDFIEGKGYLAGPFHVSFKELVQTSVWNSKIDYLCKENQAQKIILQVNPKDLNAAIGYSAKNKNQLLNYYKEVCFVGNDKIPVNTLQVEFE